jgi:hypothetical protein
MLPSTTYVLAHVGLADEELRAQILLSNELVVCECDGAYASQYEILCDFVGERLDGDEKNVGRANPVGVNCVSKTIYKHVLLFLSLHAPQTDLSVVESNLVCRWSLAAFRSCRKPRLPAEILSVSEMAATVWSAAPLSRRVPFAAGGAAAGALMSAIILVSQAPDR